MVNGIYDSRVVFGQKRVLIAWQRLIFPDGSSLNVDSMPGTDQEGTSGLKDLVDNHYFQIFGSAILMSIINAGFTLATDTDVNATDKETAQDALAKSAAQQMQQTFSRLIEKIMAIQPELIIRQGKQGHIILTKDVIGLKPYNPANKPTYFLKTVKVN
jgi:type IV secretion system protein VirB10